MQPESSDGFASVGTILPEERAALLPGGSFRFLGPFRILGSPVYTGDESWACRQLVPADIEQHGADDHEARNGQRGQHAGPKADPVNGDKEGRLAAGEGQPGCGREKGAHRDRDEDSGDPDDCDSEGELNSQCHFGILLEGGFNSNPAVQCARINFTFRERNDTIGERAEVAQLVEQLIRNQQVVGSSPTFGSIFCPGFEWTPLFLSPNK